MMKRTAMALVAAAAMAMPAISDAQNYGGRPDRGGPPDRGQYDRGPSDQYRQGFQDGYKSGYRAGNDASRNRQGYDDTDYSYGYGYSNPRRGYFSGSSYGNGPNVSDDRGQRWQQRYARNYTYNDDSFYQDCRQSVDPAGVIAGALIGGLLGNSVTRGGGKGIATVGGVIAGGAIGAALTKSMDCSDRSYAYKTYYQGFNAGRPNAAYEWRNPDNGHYGNFRVSDYYNDPDGFRCANYTQQIFVEGRPQAARGHACQQPDGTWAIVG